MSDTTGHVPFQRIIVVGLIFIGLIGLAARTVQYLEGRHKERLRKEALERQFYEEFDVWPDDRSDAAREKIATHIRELCEASLGAEWYRIQHEENVPKTGLGNRLDAHDVYEAYRDRLRELLEREDAATHRWHDALATLNAVDYPSPPLGCRWSVPGRSEEDVPKPGP